MMYAMRQMLEIVLGVLTQRLADPDSWFGGRRIEYVLATVVEAIAWAAEHEAREKHKGVSLQGVAS